MSVMSVGERPLRIGLVHAYTWPEVMRGGERYLNDLGRFLVDAGHQVEFIVGTTGQSRNESRDGVLYHWLHHLPARGPLTGLDSLQTFGARALPTLMRHRYDICHTLTPSTALASRCARQVTVYTELGAPYFTSRTPRHQKALWQAGVRSAHYVTALSMAAASRVSRLSGRNVVALYPGYWPDAFPSGTHRPSDSPRILYSGHISADNKGVPQLVEAFSRLLTSWPQATLVLVGSGDPDWVKARLSPVAMEKGWPRVVLLSPTITDLYRHYQDATVTVLPSKDEAFGIVLLESLACGRPIVAGDDCGSAEIASDPRVGRVADTRDVDALTEAIAETIALSHDPDTAANCVRHVQRWSWPLATGPAHLRLYKSLLEKHHA